MDLRPQLQIQTVLKALTDVVLPAVDPDNKLAQEQGRLAIGMLQMVLSRQPLLYRYERDELSRFVAFAQDLQSQAAALPGADEALETLGNSIEAGLDVLDRARADPAELEDANHDLREKIGALITAVYGANGTAPLKRISARVNAHAQEQLLRERSWLVALGFEPDPGALPPIESLLAEIPKTR